MSKIKITKKENSEESENFVEKPLPDAQELNQIERNINNEVRAEEIKESLAEIYQDENGQTVDVHRLEIKKRSGIVMRTIRGVILISLIATTVWYGYNYIYLPRGNDALAVELSINSDKEVVANQEFYYLITVKNTNNSEITNLQLQANYPENFIYLESEPSPQRNNNFWSLSSLKARDIFEIKIKGKLIGKKGDSAILLSDLTYIPSNITSEFKKSASFKKNLAESGLDWRIENSNNVILNEENTVSFFYKLQPVSYLTEIFVSISTPENFDFLTLANNNAAPTKESAQAILMVKPGLWKINQLDNEEKEFPIRFKVKNKIDDTQELLIKIGLQDENKKDYIFAESKINLSIIQNNLNLNIIINGSRSDQGVDFGQKLNYSLVYSNKGEVEMKDVIIMAVLESDFLDWSTIDDPSNGQKRGNTISWSKSEIEALSLLEKNNEGTIDFSINVKNYNETDFKKNFQIKSYAQYNVGDKTAEASENTRSNIITNKINTNINLVEQVVYFNQDNIAVGTGPLPPHVGETTSFKVYWSLSNNLHELNDLKIFVDLPSYINWDNKKQTTLGNLAYDETYHRVTWNIGRYPLSAYKSEAEFSISLKPDPQDYNKIIVLLPGTSIEGTDVETNSKITKTTKAKTSKLEDDPIANIDGRIQ